VKGTTVLAMLYWLGIAPSHSRPRVSDDNEPPRLGRRLVDLSYAATAGASSWA
jgi:hypothetical protein